MDVDEALALARERWDVTEALIVLGEAVGRVRALCLDLTTEGVDGGLANVDTLWPTDVLAALEGRER